jgi:hypothetical protein
MRWGRRKNPYAKRVVRGHAGPGRYITTKRQLAGDKRDLEALNKGQHLSVGLTKKRQAAYDAKDRARLEKRIAKNEKRIADREHNQQLRSEKKAERTPMSTKKKIVIGATVAGTVLAAYGAYKVSKVINKEHNKIMASKCRSWLSDIDRGVVNADADFVKGYFNGKSKDSFLRKLDTVATTHGTMKLKPGKLADAFDKRYMKLDEKEIRDILNPRHR